MGERFLKNWFDPFQLLHKDEDPYSAKAKARRKRQNIILNDYRTAYYKLLNTPGYSRARIQKLGLFNDVALDVGVSTAKGGVSLPGVTGEIPILISTTPDDVAAAAARSDEELEEIVEQTEEINRILSTPSTSTTTSEDFRKQRAAREKKREEHKRLAREAANLMYRGNHQALLQLDSIPTNELIEMMTEFLARSLAKIKKPNDANAYKEYMDIDMRRLRVMWAEAENEEKEGKYDSPALEEKYASGREEKGDSGREQKVNDGNESSDILSDLEKRVAGLQQKITPPSTGKKPRGYVPPEDENVHWRVVMELLRATTSDAPGAKLLITNHAKDVTNRVLMKIITFITKGKSEKAAQNKQRILDLLSKAGVDVQHLPGQTATEAMQAFAGGGVPTVNKARRYLNQMSAIKQRELMIAMTKLIRKLYNETPGSDPTIAANLLSMKLEEMEGEQMEKPREVADFLNIENEQLLNSLQELLGEANYSSRDISKLFEDIGTAANDTATRIFRTTGDRAEANMAAYNRMVQKIITMVQSLLNTITARTGGSFLALRENAYKVGRTLKILMDQVTSEMINSQIRFANLDRNQLRNSLTRLKLTLGQINDSITSLKTPVTRSGEPIRVPSDLEEFGVSPDDEKQARDLYNDPDLNIAGQDQVDFSIGGNEFGIGTTYINIDWSAVPRSVTLRETRSAIRQQYAFDDAVRQSAEDELDAARTVAEIYIMADEYIKDPVTRLRIAQRYGARIGGGGGDPDDPAPRVILSVNGQRRILKMGGFVALMILFGYGAKFIKDTIDRMRKGETVSVPTKPSGPKDDPMDDNNNEKDYNTSNIYPTFPRQTPRSMDFTDPIYGNMGDQITTKRFKPVGRPILDNIMGSDPITSDENMRTNSAVMKLVAKYNANSEEYNDALMELEDLQGIQDAEGEARKITLKKKLNDLTLNMNNIFELINQQGGIVPESRYYGETVAPITVLKVGRFETSLDKRYPFISTDTFTATVGLDDDIAEYNSLVEEYNSLANKYKDYGGKRPEDIGVVGDSGRDPKLPSKDGKPPEQIGVVGESGRDKEIKAMGGFGTTADGTDIDTERADLILQP